MTALRTAIEALGFADGATYMQSGNVVFRSAERDTAALATSIEQHLQRKLGLRTTVFLFTAGQLRRAAKANPFRPAGDEDHYSHLMFLDRKPDAVHVAALLSFTADDARFAVSGNVAYFAYPKSAAGHRRPIDVEKVLHVRGTVRGWKVVDALIAKVSALA
jgi:uncharacterized protein (DUF1697 family)